MEKETNKNLEFWNKYKEVPDNALKKFTNGKFSGTDINTMWRLKCLTETFGMCGIGWYFDIVRTWTETTEATHEQYAFAEIKLYVKVDGEWSKGISGNGGNKLATLKRDGTYTTSDEAYKMAITDAIGVACRNLGIGADIYWENDKTKYTQDEITSPKVSAELVAELTELGGTLDIVATIYKIKLEEVTNEHVQAVIEKKKRNLELAKKDK